MTRKRRDLDAERRDLTAAAERLLAGTPLRSASGKLTSSELITESGLRRDVVYGEHKDLVDDFKARVKAQDATPSSIARISDENRALRNANDALKKQLAEEHETTKTLTKIVDYDFSGFGNKDDINMSKKAVVLVNSMVKQMGSTF